MLWQKNNTTCTMHAEIFVRFSRKLSHFRMILAFSPKIEKCIFVSTLIRILIPNVEQVRDRMRWSRGSMGSMSCQCPARNPASCHVGSCLLWWQGGGGGHKDSIRGSWAWILGHFAHATSSLAYILLAWFCRSGILEHSRILWRCDCRILEEANKGSSLLRSRVSWFLMKILFWGPVTLQ
jgi:hypothetical protein